MKKTLIFILLVTFLLMIFTGCRNSYVVFSEEQDTDNTSAIKEIDTPQESMPKNDTNIDLFAKMNIRKDILSAMDSSKKLSGKEFIVLPNGGYYYQNSCKNYAYAYYGKKVTGVYANTSSTFILAILEDGSVYNATTPIAKDANIYDICWKTHSTNLDAYLLGKDGKIYYYNPYNDNQFQSVSGNENVTAICRAGSYPLFFCANGHVSVPNILMSGGSAEWKGVEVENWKEIVVAACAYEETKDAYTIAGISADGSVYATGNYADDILAMGDLSYITMFDDASLIVGLTPDGTIKFAGSNADDYAEIFLDGIADIKAFDGQVWAMGTNGNIYIIDNTNDIVTLTKDGSDSECQYFYMASNGDVFSNEDNLWIKTNELNARITDNINLLYYLELSKQKFNFGRDFKSDYDELKKYKFIMFDLNGDGEKEILVPQGMSIYIACIYNGTLSTSLYTNNIEGYYLKSKVLVTVRYGANKDCYDYGYLLNGIYTKFATRNSYYLEGEKPYETYEYFKKEDLPCRNVDEKQLHRENSQAISQKEFNDLLKNIVGKESMKKWEIDFQDFQPCTKENFISEFLNGMNISEDEVLPSNITESKPIISKSLDLLNMDSL